MLELTNNYCTKEINSFKDLATVLYVLIDDIYQEVIPTYIKERRNINVSLMSDSEIITISIMGELLTIDSEKAWFGFCKKNFRDLFPTFCHRTRFNRTRRNLMSVVDEIRKRIGRVLGFDGDPYRIVDSMPIPVCKFGRARYHRSHKVEASYGKCPSKKETYYGFKLHMLVSLNGYITDFTLTPANQDDRAALWDLAEKYESLTILADKGYIGQTFANELKKEKNLYLYPLKRQKSKDQYPTFIRQLIFKLRRKIETTGSQLSCQLNIQRVLAKSKWGLITRLCTKILAHNLCFLVNQLMGKDIDISKIKQLVFG